MIVKQRHQPSAQSYHYALDLGAIYSRWQDSFNSERLTPLRMFFGVSPDRPDNAIWYLPEPS
jgi:hypothetical protein